MTSLLPWTPDQGAPADWGPWPPLPVPAPRRGPGTALVQALPDNSYVVAPRSLVLGPGAGPGGDEYLINRIYRRTPVIRLVAGTIYILDSPVQVPAGGRIYLNAASIDPALISLGPGAAIADALPPPPPPPANWPDLTPADLGVKSWTLSPFLVGAGTGLTTARQRLYLVMFSSWNGGTVEAITLLMGASAANLAILSGIWLAVYSRDGQLLAASDGAVPALTTSNTPQTFTLTSPLTLQPATVYRAALVSDTNPPSPGGPSIVATNGTMTQTLGVPGPPANQPYTYADGFSGPPAQIDVSTLTPCPAFWAVLT